MKKSIIIVAICGLMVVVLGSCGANKKCPAYSQHTTEQTDNSKS